MGFFYRYNLDGFHCFVKSGLVSLVDYDKHLATAMANGDNMLATRFAMHCAKIYLVEDRCGHSSANGQVLESDFGATTETLIKISQQTSPASGKHEGIHNLVEMIKLAAERLNATGSDMAGPTAQLHSGIAQVLRLCTDA